LPNYLKDIVLELTTRQKEVLRLVYQHKRSREIATLLNLSVRTVNLHVGAAMKRLKVKSRYEAAAKAFELDLI